MRLVIFLCIYMSYTQFHFIDKIWNFVAFTPFPSSFPNDFNRNVRKPLDLLFRISKTQWNLHRKIKRPSALKGLYTFTTNTSERVKRLDETSKRIEEAFFQRSRAFVVWFAIRWAIAKLWTNARLHFHFIKF